mmetsp:Transcript_31976/g.95237  ORF Transcript_31976/g.95237 Transcript_31976/m.95237 type:complete len:290 (-) Transcript_31976:3-872(-)
MPAGPAGSQIREADAAVHADGLAVEVAIVDDVRGEQRKLLRLAETRRPGDRGQEPLLHLRRRGLHQGGVDDPRGDGHDADAEPGEVTRHGQGHAHDRAFGRGVRQLALLAFEGRYRGHVDDHSPVPLSVRRQLGHCRSTLTGAVEGPVEVDFADKVEELLVVGLQLLVHRGEGRPDPGAVDDAIQGLELVDRRLDRSADGILVGDVELHEEALRPELCLDLLAVLCVLVADGCVRALGDEQLGHGQAETACTARDEVRLASAVSGHCPVAWLSKGRGWGRRTRFLETLT